MGFAFDDIWPVIEESWIEAIRATDWTKFAASKHGDSGIAALEVQSSSGTSPGVSDEAGYLLEKLWRNDKWGSARVSVEAMQKHTHLDAAKLSAAIQELVRRRILVRQGMAGGYSLDPGKRSEIERIANFLISKKASRPHP
jgi:hypothetical protein